MPTGVYPRKDIAARFWEKVNKNGPVPESAPHLGRCWLWAAALFPSGYGSFLAYGHRIAAHRWAYQQENGPIPPEVECDHLCRVRSCVRLSHIELVTHHENLRRGVGHGNETHCPRQHPYDEKNTRIRRGKRECKACCRILAQQRYRAGRRAG